MITDNIEGDRMLSRSSLSLGYSKKIKRALRSQLKESFGQYSSSHFNELHLIYHNQIELSRSTENCHCQNSFIQST